MGTKSKMYWLEVKLMNLGKFNEFYQNYGDFIKWLISYCIKFMLMQTNMISKSIWTDELHLYIYIYYIFNSYIPYGSYSWIYNFDV